jgi:hypothetical protein
MTTDTLAVFRRPLPEALAKLRAAMAAAGVTAESPDQLDDEGERMAREERWT